MTTPPLARLDLIDAIEQLTVHELLLLIQHLQALFDVHVADLPAESHNEDLSASMRAITATLETLTSSDLDLLIFDLEEALNVRLNPQPYTILGGAPLGEDIGAYEFDVRLIDYGPNKIHTIKAIREFLRLGLKDAKTLTESAPCIVYEQTSRENAEEFCRILRDAGATAEIR